MFINLIVIGCIIIGIMDGLRKLRPQPGRYVYCSDNMLDFLLNTKIFTNSK